MTGQEQARAFYAQVADPLDYASSALSRGGIETAQRELAEAVRALESQKLSAVSMGCYEYATPLEQSAALSSVEGAHEPSDLTGAVESAIRLCRIAEDHAVEAHHLFDEIRATGLLSFAYRRRLRTSAKQAVAAEHRAVDLALQIVKALIENCRSFEALAKVHQFHPRAKTN